MTVLLGEGWAESAPEYGCSIVTLFMLTLDTHFETLSVMGEGCFIFILALVICFHAKGTCSLKQGSALPRF